MMPKKPIWELAGMNQVEYSRLPWEKMRILLIRHKGINIRPEGCICNRPRKDGFRALFDAYQAGVAEKETIRYKYPWAPSDV